MHTHRYTHHIDTHAHIDTHIDTHKHTDAHLQIHIHVFSLSSHSAFSHCLSLSPPPLLPQSCAWFLQCWSDHHPGWQHRQTRGQPASVRGHTIRSRQHGTTSARSVLGQRGGHCAVSRTAGSHLQEDEGVNWELELEASWIGCEFE